MVLAASAMAFSSIMVVLNALRLKTYKLPEFKSELIEDKIDVKEEKGGARMKVNVTDMTCGHCEMTIKKALGENGFDNIEVNLDDRTVELDLQGRKESEVITIIESKGYTVKL